MKKNISHRPNVTAAKKKLLECKCFLCFNLAFYQCLDDCSLKLLFWHFMTFTCYGSPLCTTLSNRRNSLSLFPTSSLWRMNLMINYHYLQICHLMLLPFLKILFLGFYVFKEVGPWTEKFALFLIKLKKYGIVQVLLHEKYIRGKSKLCIYTNHSLSIINLHEQQANKVQYLDFAKN